MERKFTPLSLVCPWSYCSCRGKSLVFLLLLLSGDVHRNSGPIYKYPCTICPRPMKNQRGLCCDWCDLWMHASCCGVSGVDYQWLSCDNCEWFCPPFVMIELPYTNASLNSSVGISVDYVDANNSISSLEEADPFCF